MATAIPHTGAACLHRISFEYVSFHVTPCHISPADVMSYQTVHVAKAIVIPYQPISYHSSEYDAISYHVIRLCDTGCYCAAKRFCWGSASAVIPICVPC